MTKLPQVSETKVVDEDLDGMPNLEPSALTVELQGEILAQVTDEKMSVEVQGAEFTPTVNHPENGASSTAADSGTAGPAPNDQDKNGGGREVSGSSSDCAEGSEVRCRPSRLSSRKNRENRRDSWTSSGHGSDSEDTSESKDENDPPSSNTDSTAPVGSSLIPKKRKWKRKQWDGSLAQKKRSRMNMNPFNRPPLNVLKRTGESFLQDDSCTELVAAGPKLGKCRECRLQGSKSDRQNKIICRFYGFRKLKYTRHGTLVMAGFSDPISDPKKEDLALWLPSKDIPPKSLDLELAKFIIDQVGDQFCELIQQEKEVDQINMSEEDKFVAWKRVVGGVREMCDVCDTTLFNLHWACRKCGFVVCISCYIGRKEGIVKKTIGKKWIDRDEFRWLFCSSNRVVHTLENLMLTQCIAGKALGYLGNLLHRVRAAWNIPQDCGCDEAKRLESEFKDFHFDKVVTPIPSGIPPEPVPVMGLEKDDSEEESEDEEGFGILAAMISASLPAPVVATGTKEVKVEQKILPPVTTSGFMTRRRKEPPAVLAYAITTTELKYPTVPHSWLSYGKLLHLHDPSLSQNRDIFQEVWLRGQPVIVSHVADNLRKYLWTPESFLKDFIDLKHDLVNCMSGRTLANQPLKKFWEGFEYVGKRLKDEKGNPMLLKLKDWPPGEDFAESLPSRFADLMSCLPLKEYTGRDGRLNLAARLPTNFVRPDLGPKMYIAYGSGLHLDHGTTNLHLDISDAVNLMVHIGVPKDIDNAEDHRAVLAAIEESDVDGPTIDRVRDGELPGALWHIYNSKDSSKIRDLLNKVAVERGIKLEAKHDPIHDQHWYLDKELRARLVQEYDCVGFPLVQFEGDAVFIPAGAPHQVRNLHNCIKIAEDFVSPENVSHCLDLTEEFRDLTETHSNHEDKLQIKNIIYHAVKDAVSVLYQNMNEMQRKVCEDLDDPMDVVVMDKEDDESDTGEDDDEEGSESQSADILAEAKMETCDPVLPATTIVPTELVQETTEGVLNGLVSKADKNEQDRTQNMSTGMERGE